MKVDIENFWQHDVQNLTNTLNRLAQEIPADEEPQEDDSLVELTAALSETVAAAAELEHLIAQDEELVSQTKQQFRDAIKPWFDQSWFMERAFTKPRGYPGDFVLLSAIYDNVPKSRGIGGYLDLYFLDQTLAHGVRTRLASARRFLTEEILRRKSQLSILNIACGPAREFEGGFDTDGQTVSLKCIDMDQQALDHVQSQVACQPGVDPDFECVCYNALRMASSKATVGKFGRSDVIYSIGLCDYIPDDYMIRLLRGWRESLAEGGVVYVAFKDRLLYNAAVYQWLVDWYFYQRTEEDCLHLYQEAGYDMSSIEVQRDGDGVIMNFIARPSHVSETKVRVDRADEPASTAAPSSHLTHAGKVQQLQR
ncbi:MAG: class I SAM-dependent methyltransferase [Planctomycetaceae bacterium]|nr:class I SAM-dependent methyltransferase [Planctomycetaceae bacterium]